MFINKKSLYLLFLSIITLLGFVLAPTYAKFSDNYTSENNIVGMDLNFEVGISEFDEFEEYEEIIIPANGTISFNVSINNIRDDIVYYGIWFRTITPNVFPTDNSIEVGKLLNTTSNTSGALASNNIVTTSIGVINNTGNEIKISIGVNSSLTSENDIEYINGKTLITGEVDTTLKNHIINLYNNSTDKQVVYIGGDEANSNVLQSKETGIMLDNNSEYRYYGKNPNNYVSFNNEIWRIISVSTVYTGVGDTIGTTRVKLIRNEPLKTYAFNLSEEGKGTNNWMESDLKNALNDLYYNTNSGICFSSTPDVNEECNFTTTGLINNSRNMIDYAMYYLGEIDTTIDSLYPSDFYKQERNINANKWSGLVGLIYPSDYLYAADLSQCTKVASSNDQVLNYSDQTCTNNNWLYNKDAFNWTITPSTYSQNSNIGIIEEGYITSFETDLKGNVQPVVYLNTDVIITGGIGTRSEPYTIA